MPGRDTAKDMTIRDLRARLARVETERDHLRDLLHEARSWLPDSTEDVLDHFEFTSQGRPLGRETL